MHSDISMETKVFHRVSRLILHVKQLEHGKDLPLPSYATENSAGMDLYAAIEDALTIEVGKRTLVPTGICLEIPAGYEGQVRPRSGLALKHGIGMVNAPGTIDSDYRGEIGVILINLGDRPYVIHRGDRIAQLIISPVMRVQVSQAIELNESGRGDGGFGHSGV
jgi:dUTP pyrophosphatase